MNFSKYMHKGKIFPLRKGIRKSFHYYYSYDDTVGQGNWQEPGLGDGYIRVFG